MSSNDPTNREAMLQRALCVWEIKDPLPPRFEEQVWQRIARAETQAPALWALLSSWISRALARPRLAASYVAVLLLMGLLAGYWQAQMEKNRTMESLSSRYVGLIDPYKTSGP